METDIGKNSGREKHVKKDRQRRERGCGERRKKEREGPGSNNKQTKGRRQTQKDVET